MTKFRKSALAALVAVGVMGMAGAASAAVVGGGATLPEGLYGKANASTDANGQPYDDHGIGILHDGAGFNPYVGVGRGAGKRAFFLASVGRIRASGTMGTLLAALRQTYGLMPGGAAMMTTPPTECQSHFESDL